jgi:hypothetical protein
MFETFLLRSPLTSHRIRALTNLRHGLASAPVGAVVPLLSDKSPSARRLACEILGFSNDQSVAGALESVVRKDTLEVAQIAVRALGKLGNSSSVPLLIEMLADRPKEVIVASVDALSDLGMAAKAQCVAAITGPNWVRRHNAALVLSRMNWTPDNDAERVHALVLRGQIDEAVALGAPASAALTLALEDPAKTLPAALGLVKLGDERGATGVGHWLTGAIDSLCNMAASNAFSDRTKEATEWVISEATKAFVILGAIPGREARASQAALFTMFKDSAHNQKLGGCPGRS